MRISLLIVDLIVNGGSQRQLLQLGKWLQEFGHTVTIYAYRYSPTGCYPELTRSLDVRYVKRCDPHSLPKNPYAMHRRLLLGTKRHLYESWKLAQLIRQPGDVLNPHARAATRAAVYCKRRTGVPVVWMCNDAANWEQPGYRPYFSSPLQWLFDRVMTRLERPVVRDIDRIVALDHRVQKIVEGFYGRPTQVVRSGLDWQAFCERPGARNKIRERHRIPDSAFLLLWLGILEPHRRLEDALEAMRRLREHPDDIRFLVVGSDAFATRYARQLREFVARHGLDPTVQMVFRSVREEEMPDYYSACDALVYPCENMAWGLAVFEAMACGRPAIVSTVCGAQELLRDRETGLLVPGRDPAALAKAVLELARHRPLWARIAHNAREFVRQQLSWDKYARDMTEVFHETIGKPAALVRA